MIDRLTPKPGITVEEWMPTVVSELRRRAKHGTFDGKMSREAFSYMRHCTYDDGVTHTRLILTRDTGHHTSGWLKNPDYERCWHLSTSAEPTMIVLPGVQRTELDAKTVRQWVVAFFGDAARYVWSESPKSEVGKQRGVWHWRLFCDAQWAPILPRKEVYSREFTEEGWQSASQVLSLEGYHRSETEDGRVIESTVDPT